MATYTSTQNGNWSDDATWGGGGHPSANDDIINVGHTVTYDMGDSVVTWGSCTITSGGILTFPIDADSTILFNATAILTINSGGELRAGTSGAPVDKDYHCYFHWPQGNYRNCFVINDNATISIYGDSNLYGATRYAYLNSNWSSGQTLYITGDYETLWQAGQKFFINQNTTFNNQLTDSSIFTIATIGPYDNTNDRTPITISEAAPGVTFYADGSGFTSLIINISRNIHICDINATADIGYYSVYGERCRCVCNQTSSNTLIYICDALIYGWDYGMNGGYNVIMDNVVYIANDDALFNIYNFIIDGDFISNSKALDTAYNLIVSGSIDGNGAAVIVVKNSVINADFISNYQAIAANSLNNKITGDFVTNQSAIISQCNIIIGNFYLNTRSVYTTNSIIIIGNIISSTWGIDSCNDIKIIGDFSLNVTDIFFSQRIHVVGELSGGENSAYASSTINTSIVYDDCTISGSQKDYRVYENSGTILPLESGDGDWQTPPSDNSYILQITPNSYCADRQGMRIILSPLRDMALYCDAGTYTLTLKIYPHGWTTPLNQDDIYIKASYLSGTGSDYGDIQTTSSTFANDGWREISVTFTTGRAGIVYFNLYFTAYESACYVLVDPQWVITPISTTLSMYILHGAPFKFSGFCPATGTSLEAKIYATLTAAASVTSKVSDRIYPQHRRQNESRPALAYFRIGGQRDNTLTGYSNLENPRISIECYATAIDARRELADAVVAAITASTHFNAISAMSPVDIYDPGIEEYKRVLDFSIWNHDT